MIITWDRHAQPALESQRATIEIADGARRVLIDLDRHGVTRGNATYIRQSGRVDLRMRIYRAHDDVEERVTFLERRLFVAQRGELKPRLCLRGGKAESGVVLCAKGGYETGNRVSDGGLRFDRGRG